MIPGNSGCHIFTTGETLTKVAGHEQAERLYQQMEIQQSFYHPIIRTPRVIDKRWTNTGFEFCMEYIKDAKTVFNASVSCLETLLGFVLDNLEKSRYHSIPAEVFVNKINSIDVGEFKWYADDLKRRFFCAGSVYLPIGPMHGDLSLTNVLCRGSDVWLIDFLDGFLSSPLFDVAKMRQDSCHGWIELFDDAPNREYVDRRILDNFGHEPWLRELTLLALLRIIPYAKSERVLNFLRREIPRAFNNLE